MKPRSLALFLALLLLLSAVPDTMAAPVLKELFVDRYGVGPRGAQVFMAINLVGALAAVPLLAWARRRTSAATLVVLASVADGGLLLVLAAPIGFVPSLALRALEGVTDVVVFAALFDIVRSNSGGHAARGLGLASTPLLLGLGLGAVIGGQAAQVVGTGSDATAFAVFGASALFCAAVAVLAGLARGRLPAAARSPTIGRVDEAPPNPATDVAVGTFDDRPRPLWWPCAMAFADRATGGLITGTLPLVLADALGYTKRERGWLIGLPLLLMALCTGPAGMLCDSAGSLRVRLVAGAAYAVAFAAIPIAGESQVWLFVAMVGVGVSGAMLFSSSLAIAAQARTGSVALGAFRAAGDLGFFTGTSLAIVLLATMGQEAPTYSDYAWIILIFAAGHLCTTGALAFAAVRRMSAGPRAVA